LRKPLVPRLAVFEGPARQNALGSLLIQGSFRLARLVVVVAAAALLVPTSFAAVALALALTDLVRGGLQAFDIGAMRGLTRGDEAAAVIQASLDAKGFTGTVGVVLLAAVSVLVYDTTTAWLVIVSGVGVLAASLATSFLVRQQAALALRSVGSTVAVASVAGALLALVMLWLTRSALGIVIGLAVGDALVLALLCGGHRWRRPSWRLAAAELGRSRALLVMQLAYIGQFRLGTVVLAAGGSAIAVGEYAIASRLAEGLIILAAALTASSFPLIGVAHARNERARLADIFGRSYRLGMMAIAPLIAVLVIATPAWVGVLFRQYPGVGSPLGIVGLAVIVYFASSQTTALLNATGRDRAASRSAVAGLAVAALASIPLVSLGAVGVAWARVGGEVVRLLVESAAAVRGLAIRPRALVGPWFGIFPILSGAAIAIAGNWEPLYLWIASAVALAGSVRIFPVLRAAGRSG
jgi:O-antigen/teichoic acid export membrane protein